MHRNPYAEGSDQWRAWQKGYSACHDDWKRTAEVIRNKPKPSRWRSSVLGRWVSKAFAEANPETTQRHG